MSCRRDVHSPAAVALVVALLLPGGPAFGCAVATTIRVENRTLQIVEHVFVSAPDRGPNQAPEGGLPPGATATITLPSCLGIYAVTAILADRSERRHDGINATVARGITLR